ncbi:hypothetical protein GB937_007749 [Aspergillus fischeri]|nr:hypothetical protein GB937_007749 [Aspergillus fischeri]
MILTSRQEYKFRWIASQSCPFFITEYRFKSAVPISRCNSVPFLPFLRWRRLLSLNVIFAFSVISSQLTLLDDEPCGSAKSCVADCPSKDFFPMIDQCDLVDGKPDCYVNFYCA